MKKQNHAKAKGTEEHIKGRVLATAGFPADADCSIPLIVITGKGYVRVEHHCGVLQLTDCRVRLRSRIGVISIEGEKLAVSSVDNDVMLLDGRVRSVSYE